jgi:hypothetical protein
VVKFSSSEKFFEKTTVRNFDFGTLRELRLVRAFRFAHGIPWLRYKAVVAE